VRGDAWLTLGTTGNLGTEMFHAPWVLCACLSTAWDGGGPRGYAVLAWLGVTGVTARLVVGGVSGWVLCRASARGRLGDLLGLFRGRASASATRRAWASSRAALSRAFLPNLPRPRAAGG